jgi:hypothetical protein
MPGPTPPDSKPNVLVIWGDGIGITNLSLRPRCGLSR